MKKKELIKKGIVLLLTASMLLGGCGTKSDEAVSDATVNEDTVEVTEEDESKAQTSVADNELVAALKEQYNGAAADYSGETLTVDRNESIEVTLGYNPYETDDVLSECFNVYQDAALTQPLDDMGLSMDYDATTGILSIEPPFYGIAEVDEYGDIDLSDLSGNYLFGDEEAGWGNLPQYYFATYVDTETGKKLDSPKVTVVKVNTELSKAPQVKFAQTDNGEARFYWEEVPGAEEYLVFTIKKWPDMGFDNAAQIVGVSKTNEWVYEDDMIHVDEEDDRIVYGYMNELFSQYYISDDDADDVRELEEAAGIEDITDDVYNEYWDDYFGVIAVGKGGCSVISNVISAQDLCHLLPNSIAYNDGDDTVFGRPEGTLNLPATMGITMCDGTTAQKVIDYDYDNIVVDEEYQSAEIKATAHGTYFSWPITFNITNMDSLQSDLDQIKARQAELLSKGGNVDTTLDFDDSTESETPEEAEKPAKEEASEEAEKPAKEEASEEAEKPAKEEASEETEEPAEEESSKETEESAEEESSKETDAETASEGDKTVTDDLDVTANSALSAYIALCMLASEETIDLSAFPEASDSSYVADAFAEAQYQNPLILGIQKASMDTDNMILYVGYDYDAATTRQKQEKVSQKVDEVVAEIITDNMSDLEKEMAINDYLCDNAEYDFEALDNAEANDFYYVDEEYYDSFTAYGTLVDGVGVCAGYSAAFKLLADAAGLDSIVVTGYLEGTTPHAWNKVKVDDTWNIVDSTNNDNEVIRNALFNLSDTSASAALTEDGRFALDDVVYNYSADSDENEYYKAKGDFYPVSEIADALADGLTSGSDVMLRTDFDLDDAEFNEVAGQAAENAGKDLQGCYWMGVIRLMEAE